MVNAELPRRASNCLAHHAFLAEVLDLQITEAELIQNIKRARPHLDALEEFGTGYFNAH